VAGVQRADAYVLAEARLTTPDGHAEPVVVVGCDPASLLGAPRFLVEGNLQDLRHPDAVLIDRCDAAKLGHCRIGDMREIGGRRARIVGKTAGLVGFTTRPYVFTTLDRARTRYGTGHPPHSCSYFLVQVKPGADVAAVVQRIRQRVPDLDVYDRRTYSNMSMWFWFTRTGIGISFGLATFLGVCVGLGVVAQTLYSSVTERIKEFATLKALGADNRCVSRFLFSQALVNALLGSALGLLTASVLGATASTPRAPIQLNGSVALGSVLLVSLVCLGAAWLPYWRIRRIDPSSVLRS
jgi:putative ABC transport system permease protein